MFRRPIKASAAFRFLAHGLFDGRVPVAENDRPPRAHEIDVLPSVHIRHPRGLAAGEELRVTAGQGFGALMAPHAAGDDAGRPVAQGAIPRGIGLDEGRIHTPAPSVWEGSCEGAGGGPGK